jgi:hypothetical protein
MRRWLEPVDGIAKRADDGWDRATARDLTRNDKQDMQPTDRFLLWLGGFVAGTLVYVALTLLTFKRIKDQPWRLVLLGMLTVLIAAWLGGLADAGTAGAQGFGMNLPAAVVDRGPAVLSRVGMILVLAGLAGFLWRPGANDEPPQIGGGGS